MKVALQTLLRLLAGIYFILTSLYCLLAFLPYTYCAFIKAPPYAWMPWFTHHSAILYWIAAAAGMIGANPDCWRQRSRIMQPSFLVTLSFFTVGGLYLTARPFLPQLQNTPAAYFWSIAGFSEARGFRPSRKESLQRCGSRRILPQDRSRIRAKLAAPFDPGIFDRAASTSSNPNLSAGTTSA